MNISVREFLDYSFNYDYITIVNNIPSKTPGLVYKTIWEGKFETMDNHIPWEVQVLDVVKWGIENNGVVLFVNYEKDNK